MTILVLITATLVINEIHHAPADPSLEFVELHNMGDLPVDLASVSLYDAVSASRAVSQTSVLLAPSAYVVLVRDELAFTAAFPGRPYIKVAGWPVLNNGGDRVGIAVGGTEVDAVPYSADWGIPGFSLERVDPLGPSNAAVNWGASKAPERASPGERNSIYKPDRTPPELVFADRPHRDSVFVAFSEPVVQASFSVDHGSVVQAWPSGDGLSAVLQTTGSPTVVSATGASDSVGNVAERSETTVLSIAGPGDVRFSERLAFPLRDAHDGLPDQFAYAEIESVIDAPISVRSLVLGQNEGGNITLAFPHLPLPARGHALIIDQRAVPDTAWIAATVPTTSLTQPTIRLLAGGLLIDEASSFRDWYSDDERGRSLERIRTGNDRFSWTVSFDPTGGTPGRSNSFRVTNYADVRPGGVRITEVLFDATGLQPEFVEIIAREEVRLDGLQLMVHRSPVDADSARFSRRPATLSADELAVMVVGKSSSATLPAALISAAFPATPESVRVVAAPTISSLRDAGGTLSLRNRVGVTVDSVQFDPDWHHPGVFDPDGISLVRVSSGAPGTQETSWTSSRAEGGASPGWTESPNDVAAAGTAEPLTVAPEILVPDRPVRIQSSLFDGAWSGRITVFDRSGRPVRTVLNPVIGYDAVTAYWDGRSNAGFLVPPGLYVVVSEGWQDGRQRVAKAVVAVGRE